LAGSLRLFTAVPLIIHPQFESANLRKRVQMGYELYHCGSEESFEQTMRKLHADVVIFEYARCFFTPYILDDRRKNCNSKKHKPEEQLCVKLHAQSRRFQLIFTNGGYAVFRLRASALPEGRELSPSAVANILASAENWHDYVDECTRTQGPDCGARLLETAAAWEHGLKRKPVASTLRKLADKGFPEDGYVAYYLGRYLDYEANNAARAAGYYKRAVKLLPNNALIVKEYIMFLDMAMKDSKAIEKLLKDRRAERSSGATPFLAMEGPGVGSLLCEASVSAKNTRGLEKFGDEMWEKALRLAPVSECVKTNWQLIYGEQSSYTESHGPWDMVRFVVTGGIQHEVSSHHQPAVRFLGHRTFILEPMRQNRT